MYIAKPPNDVENTEFEMCRASTTCSMMKKLDIWSKDQQDITDSL